MPKFIIVHTFPMGEQRYIRIDIIVQVGMLGNGSAVLYFPTSNQTVQETPSQVMDMLDDPWKQYPQVEEE